MKSIVLSIILVSILATSAFAGGNDIATMVAGQSLTRLASESGNVTYQIQKEIGGPLGRIAGDMVDQYAVDNGLSEVIKDVGGPDPRMNRTEQLIHGEVANVIVKSLFSIFK
jgi:hypothetical protein